jgi:hypothetical protein
MERIGEAFIVEHMRARKDGETVTRLMLLITE